MIQLQRLSEHLTIAKFIKFCLVGCIGLAINSAIQIALRDSALSGFWFIIVGNVPGVVWNFFGNAVWTFRRKSNVRP